MRALCLFTALCLLGCRSQAQVQTQPVAPTSQGTRLLPPAEEQAQARDALPEGWETVPLGDHVVPARVSWLPAEGVLAIAAEGEASMFARALPALAPDARPRLRWQWKVSRALETARLGRKSGDDAAARVLVGFAFEPDKASLFERLAYNSQARKSPFVPGTALCYVWAGHEEPGTLLSNPYNEQVRVIVVASGSEHAGNWQSVERDLLADYQEAFGEAPPALEGIALMVDSDQTGGSVEGWFRELVLE